MKAPCYKCTRRTEGCHSHCEGYKDWTAQQTELRRQDRLKRLYMECGTVSQGVYARAKQGYYKGGAKIFSS